MIIGASRRKDGVPLKIPTSHGGFPTGPLMDNHSLQTPIRKGRRHLGLQRRLDAGGADAEAANLMLHQATYARAWERSEIWPSEDDEAAPAESRGFL
jgi:hypothetical protein